MSYRILDHSIPIHSGYTFRAAAIPRSYRRLIRAVLMYGEPLRRNANVHSAWKMA
ncbi:MAG: hypothetical protein Q8O38_10380 [Sulfurimicrobium sp.]|nr:hypothetical protein [Sulfurimicrobium sp.]